MSKAITYWNKFYQNFSVTKKYSNFASFVIKKINKNSDLLLDIGCGNGRDTFFFIKNKVRAIGIDQSSTIINKNKKFKKIFLI